MRQSVEVHQRGLVAPLDDIAHVFVEGTQLWFPDWHASLPTSNNQGIARIQEPLSKAFMVVSERRIEAHINELDVQGGKTRRGRGTWRNCSTSVSSAIRKTGKTISVITMH